MFSAVMHIYRLPRTRKLDPVRKGRDTEVLVMARAIRPYVELRVLIYGRKTGVFD